MPILKKDIDEYGLPISFPVKKEVNVFVGPCTTQSWTKKKIPLDGRHYRCAGIIICNNGDSFEVSFDIRTHIFDFLDKESVYVQLEDGYYSLDEDLFLEKTGLAKEDIYPYKWMPNVPLDYHEKGPYQMQF